MAISNATRLANFGTGIGTQGAIIQVDNANARLGIGTSNPNSTLTVGHIGASGTSIYVHGDGRVTGVITATGFVGDGSGITGLPGQADFWIKTAAGINTTVSVGIGTTRPDSIARVNNTSILNVGILTAYQLYGDGANLTNVAYAGTATVPGISTQFHSIFNTVSASGIVTASSFKVGVGGTDIFSTIETKASTGKAIAMAMVFG